MLAGDSWLSHSPHELRLVMSSAAWALGSLVGIPLGVYI